LPGLRCLALVCGALALAGCGPSATGAGTPEGVPAASESEWASAWGPAVVGPFEAPRCAVHDAAQDVYFVAWTAPTGEAQVSRIDAESQRVEAVQWAVDGERDVVLRHPDALAVVAGELWVGDGPELRRLRADSGAWLGSWSLSDAEGGAVRALLPDLEGGCLAAVVGGAGGSRILRVQPGGVVSEWCSTLPSRPVALGRAGDGAVLAFCDSGEVLVVADGRAAPVLRAEGGRMLGAVAAGDEWLLLLGDERGGTSLESWTAPARRAGRPRAALRDALPGGRGLGWDGTRRVLLAPLAGAGRLRLQPVPKD